MTLEWIEPEWPAPPRVRALTTTRSGGVSRGPYAGLNLADHVGDEPQAVRENRAMLQRELGLSEQPRWLEQVHGCDVVRIEGDAGGCKGDAAVARESGRVCAVLTADCLPLLLCDRAGSRVAAVHAGWRGLLEGVIESALDALDLPGSELLCWLGPAIGPDTFEVGHEVRDAFIERDPGSVQAFQPSPSGRWLADIHALALRRLAARDVGWVSGGGHCTVSEPSLFYSYRRDGATGRMASLIWIEGG